MPACVKHETQTTAACAHMRVGTTVHRMGRVSAARQPVTAAADNSLLLS
jgi:hypothetical protein